MQGSNGSDDVNFSRENDEVDDAEHSLFDDDLTQVNDPTQLDDHLTQVDDDQTQVSDDDLTQVDNFPTQNDDNPALIDDSQQGSNGLQKLVDDSQGSGLQKSDENLDQQSDSTHPKSITAEKSKLSKKSAAMEKVVGGIVDKFMTQQQQAETRFFNFEEKMRKKEREHEERMMMGMMHSSFMPVAAHILLHFTTCTVKLSANRRNAS